MKKEKPNEKAGVPAPWVASHPSYGVIEIASAFGGGGALFGSTTQRANFFTLTIHQARVERDPERHKTTYFREMPLLKVDMTPLQLAQLISAGHQTGEIPCTIRFKNGKWVPPTPVNTTERHCLLEEFALEMKRLGAGCDDLLALARTLHDKPSVTKADREKFLELAEGLVCKIVAAQPHIASRFADFIENIEAERAANETTGA